MVFKYTLIGSNPDIGSIYRPLLPVRFHRENYGFKSYAVVDSGSWATILNKVHARKLGLSWDKGKESDVIGIFGKSQKMYLYDIEFDVVGLAGSKRTIKVGFVDLDNVDVLLGQVGFFEHYYVKFRHPDRDFCVEIP
jgi:hypothetical protein